MHWPVVLDKGGLVTDSVYSRCCHVSILPECSPFKNDAGRVGCVYPPPCMPLPVPAFPCRSGCASIIASTGASLRAKERAVRWCLWHCIRHRNSEPLASLQLWPDDDHRQAPRTISPHGRGCWTRSKGSARPTVPGPFRSSDQRRSPALGSKSRPAAPGRAGPVSSLQANGHFDRRSHQPSRTPRALPARLQSASLVDP
jgi:hypothetical protein